MAKRKYIETPDKMETLFNEYVKEVKDNPRTKMVFVGKDGYKDKEELEKPLTMVGFENYVYDSGFNSELSHYFSNKDGRYADYVAICRTIRNKIRQDQIEGGMVGQYNPSITQRLNGLTDKKEVDTKGDITITFE